MPTPARSSSTAPSAHYFALPDAKADAQPPFIALMYHGRDTGAFEMPADELNSFIARRMEMMRSGDSTPINILLKDGRVLRFSCTALPDGGRMLAYTPVTDLVRHTDDPADAEYYRALRGSDLSLSRVAPRGGVASRCTPSPRHARPCPGHPRLSAASEDVDARDKPGHDELMELLRTSSHK